MGRNVVTSSGSTAGMECKVITTVKGCGVGSEDGVRRVGADGAKLRGRCA